MQGLGFRTAVRSITWMSPGSSKRATSQPWLESLGDWTWPGLGAAAAAEVLPPPWVPAQPPALARHEGAPALPAPWLRARRLLILVLLGALAAVSAGLGVEGRLGFGGHAGIAPA